MSDTSLSGNARSPEKKPFQFSLRAMLIGVAVFAVVLGALMTLVECVRAVRRAELRYQCSNNLKQIAMALHNYHDSYRSFPPAYLVGPDGKPWHSWRMLVIPFVEKGDTYDRYAFDEPWNGPRNRKLSAYGTFIYRCPAEDARVPPTTTNYVALVGPGTAWPAPEPTHLRDFRDGTKNSILVVEVADSGIHWMEPRDLVLEDLPLAINPKSGKGISSNHVGGACVCLADGSVRFLSNDVAADTLRRMITINDGEPVPWDEISPDR